MLKRRTTGSVVCPSCGSLVGVRDDKCYTCGRSNPGLWGFAPMLRQLGNDLGFVPLVIGASTTLYALTLLLTLLTTGRVDIVGGGGFSFLAPNQYALRLFGMSGAVPVFEDGWWWTLLSATWLHGSLLHILFNMMWVRDLAPATADVIGASRTVIIYTVAGVCGFLLSSATGYFLGGLPIPLLHGAAFTMGASASIFGLLGALVHYGRTSGSSFIHGQAMRYAVILFIFGLIMPGVDNYAHAGGFAGGYITSAFFNPLTRERGDHMLAAVACLFATLLAILFSVVHGLGIV
ncbi:MAG: rhomboid family intramembrane serine protease [Acidobacteria bacterium]|nr:MAG: rhomboid family intramembrane serine protease [Acidobacteriota bacterium]PYQ79381.1 MAG: rhomboid family intramembrane serine protease [Acidobacteriota bacterium]PYQ89580.1 MAG: rhomboid family intramembrane serine protease [Acidobacteriota bacterium]PYR03728.1 MAG: rhomboid family intramembrane serine protease [Acidobacteriota bacterium]PYR12895.1 MAG: rhomboid family intramembrane serine protease [Acidobacteriota bacterium]